MRPERGDETHERRRQREIKRKWGGGTGGGGQGEEGECIESRPGIQSRHMRK